MDPSSLDQLDFAARFHLLVDAQTPQGSAPLPVPLDAALRWWNLGWVTQSASSPWRWRPTEEGLVVLQSARMRDRSLSR